MTKTAIHTETRSVPCKLTADEVRNKADELANKHYDYEEKDRKKKDYLNHANEELKGLRGAMSGLAANIKSRTEDRPVDCTWRLTKGEMVLTRDDTKKVVEARKATTDELQGVFDFEEGGEG